MHEVKVYGERDNKLYWKAAEGPFIKVTLTPHEILSERDRQDFLRCIQQIERHVDNVEIAALEYDSVWYTSLEDEDCAYESRAELLANEALRASGQSTDAAHGMFSQPIYEIRVKRTEQEELFSRWVVNFNSVVEQAFDAAVFETDVNQFSAEQLTVLNAVRDLRQTLSTPK